MRRSVLMVLVVALVALVFAPVAMAQDDNPTGDDMMTATPTATATATSTATATTTTTATGTATAAGGGGGKKAERLPRTGGPAPIALLAGVALVGSGVVALGYLRRREIS